MFFSTIIYFTTSIRKNNALFMILGGISLLSFKKLNAKEHGDAFFCYMPFRQR